MSLLSALRPGLRPAVLPGAPGGAQLGVASPWSSVQLSSIVWADLLDARFLPANRAQAMAVPAVARARHIICGTIARDELRAYRGETRLDAPSGEANAAPPWIDATNSALSAFHRMLWTADDIFFHGWSCWSRVNGAPDAYGRRLPLRMDRIAIERWGFDGDGHVLVDGLPVTNDSVVLIPGPHEGLLNFAQDTIRHAGDLQRAASRAAKHPAAYLALKQTGGTPLTPDEKKELIAGWARAREGLEGGVAFLNQSVDVEELGTFDKHLVVDGRNAAAVDVARSASLPSDVIDADPGISFSYTNSQDADRRLIDYGVGLYMAPITAALSMDGVTARGQRVVFALEEWLNTTVPGQDPVATTSASASTRSATPGPVSESA